MKTRISMLALVMVFASAAHASEKGPRHGEHHHGADSHEVLPSAPHTITKDSIYVVKGELTTPEGKAIQLEALRGKPVLLSMFYATCPKACPMLISDLKRIEAQLDEETRSELQVVLVTFDPERDTPESLRKLRAAHGVDEERWSMLRTSEALVEELAAILGIRYRFAPDGSIHHSTVITLLDKDGVIQERVEGLRQPAGSIVRKLNGM